MAGIKTNVTAERNGGADYRKKKDVAFFVVIAAGERVVPKKIRLLQIKNYN